MAEIVGYDAEKRRALLRWGDRMSRLPKLCLIPREALQTQFGTGYGRLRDSKRKFLASAASRGSFSVRRWRLAASPALAASRALGPQ